MDLLVILSDCSVIVIESQSVVHSVTPLSYQRLIIYLLINIYPI